MNVNQTHATMVSVWTKLTATDVTVIRVTRDHIVRQVGYTIFERKKVQVGKDQEKAQSEKDSHSKNRGGKKPN